MIVETITTERGSFIRITAENDLCLTNGEVTTEPNGSVDLGKLDKVENWWEIEYTPESEAE